MVYESDVLPYVTMALVLASPWILGSYPPLRYYGKFIVYYYVLFVGCTFQLPFFMMKSRDVANARLVTPPIRVIGTLFLGIHYVIENPEILAEDRGAVIVSNHRSTLDILGIWSIWDVPHKVAVVGRKELFYLWPFGLLSYLCGAVFIDRSSPEKAYRSLQETVKLVKNDKVKIWLFPEGTRNKEANETRKLKPFKRGAFKLAVACQEPIIPAVFSPYYFLDRTACYFGTGKITIRALDPIPTAGLTEEDIPDLMEKTHAAMQAAFDDLCARAEAKLPDTHPFVANKITS